MLLDIMTDFGFDHVFRGPDYMVFGEIGKSGFGRLVHFNGDILLAHHVRQGVTRSIWKMGKVNLVSKDIFVNIFNRYVNVIA